MNFISDLTKIEYFQKKRAFRKERPSEEEQWQLSRFYPIIEVYLRLSELTTHANYI